MTSEKTQLHFPAQTLAPGYNLICSPENSPLRWLTFGRLWLPAGTPAWEHQTGGNEEVLALVHGGGVVAVEGGQTFTLAPRPDPFAAPPTYLYLPPGCTYRVVPGAGGLDAALSAAEAEPGGQPLLLPPESAVYTRHGAGRWARKVYLGTTLNYPIQRLMVGETLNRPGGWTSYPPHKHDEANPPHEMPYEEIYFYQFKPGAGFGMQRVYDLPGKPGGIDAAYVVKDGDTVAVPHGNHPVAGAPGYRMWYLWVMCGEKGSRTYGQTNTDPAHRWILDAEPLIEADF